MVYKLLALDIDGTVLRSDRGLSRRTVRALHLARRQGLDYTLVTGRQWAEARPVARALDVRLPVICQNGAHILEPATGKDLLHRRIPLPAACAVTRALERTGVVYYHYMDERILVPRSRANSLLWGRQGRIRNFMALKGWLRWLLESRLNLDIVPVNAMESYLNRMGRGPTAITAWDGTPDALVAVPDQTLAEIELIRNDAHSWNIVPRGASKQQGLAFLANHLGICRQQIVAVGDSYNDLPMVSWAGLGVAMGNAPPEVQAASHRVTARNDEDGVAVLLEQLLA